MLFNSAEFFFLISFSQSKNIYKFIHVNENHSYVMYCFNVFIPSFFFIFFFLVIINKNTVTNIFSAWLGFMWFYVRAQIVRVLQGVVKGRGSEILLCWPKSLSYCLTSWMSVYIWMWNVFFFFFVNWWVNIAKQRVVF